jgi:hypothetical protein
VPLSRRLSRPLRAGRALSSGRIVGHAMYVRSRPDAVEVAFAVADELQAMALER